MSYDPELARAVTEITQLRAQVRDYEQELERHATDRVNQRAEVARLTEERDLEIRRGVTNRELADALFAEAIRQRDHQTVRCRDCGEGLIFKRVEGGEISITHSCAARDARIRAEALKEAAQRARKRALMPGNPAVEVLLAVALDLDIMAETTEQPK